MLISEEILKILIPSSIAIIVALLSHQLAKSKEIKESRRKHRIEYLLKAYQNLMIYSNNPNQLEQALALREANITIQIYGSKWQVDQVRNLNTALQNKENFSLDPLLNNLRDELRSILKLEKVEGNVYWNHPHPRLTQNLDIHGQK